MPKVILDDLPTYDAPGPLADRAGPLGPYLGRAVSAGYGMRLLGANVETLHPGSASSYRHWHERTDELVVVLRGELTLVETGGETRLTPGDIAVFPAGEANGHCLRNDSAAPADFLVVGTRDPEDRCHYPDLDLVLHPGGRLTKGGG